MSFVISFALSDLATKTLLYAISNYARLLLIVCRMPSDCDSALRTKEVLGDDRSSRGHEEWGKGGSWWNPNRNNDITSAIPEDTRKVQRNIATVNKLSIARALQICNSKATAIALLLCSVYWKGQPFGIIADEFCGLQKIKFWKIT